MEFLGSIDACDSMAIEGWLWFPDMPKFKPEVEVFSGTSRVSTALPGPPLATVGRPRA